MEGTARDAFGSAREGRWRRVEQLESDGANDGVNHSYRMLDARWTRTVLPSAQQTCARHASHAGGPPRRETATPCGAPDVRLGLNLHGEKRHCPRPVRVLSASVSLNSIVRPASGPRPRRFPQRRGRRPRRRARRRRRGVDSGAGGM
eukprot:gene11652-biopygen21415